MTIYRDPVAAFPQRDVGMEVSTRSPNVALTALVAVLTGMVLELMRSAVLSALA